MITSIEGRRHSCLVISGPFEQATLKIALFEPSGPNGITRLFKRDVHGSRPQYETVVFGWLKIEILLFVMHG